MRRPLLPLPNLVRAMTHAVFILGMAAAALTAQAAPGRELPAAVQQLPVSPHALGTFPFLNAPANYS